MTRALAMTIDRRPVRIGLVVVGVVVTIGLGPVAAFGAYASLASLFQGQINDTAALMSSGIAGLGGLIGLIGAWSRVIYSTARFRASPVLVALTSAALAIGILAAVIVFFVHSAGPSNPAAWWFVAFSVLGTFLLLGTVGARPNAT